MYKDKFSYSSTEPFPICIFETLNTSQMDNIIPYNLGSKINGTLSVYGTPVIKIVLLINNQPLPLEAAIDTGASKNHITPIMVKLLNLSSTNSVKGLYPLSGLSESNLFSLDFNFIGIDNMFNEDFAELPFEFPFPIILGSNFLLKCKYFNVDILNRSFEVGL